MHGNESLYNCDRPTLINVIIVIYSEYFATTSADFTTEMWISLQEYNMISWFSVDSCQFGRAAMNE